MLASPSTFLYLTFISFKAFSSITSALFQIESLLKYLSLLFESLNESEI